MFAVGIFTGDKRWSEVLADLLKPSGSRVSGWVNPLDCSQHETQQLIDGSDLIWIPRKIGRNMEEAIKVIRCSRHLSLGFPIVEFADEAPFLVKLAHEAHVQVQVGHRDWHLPAFRSSLMHVCQPQCIHINDFLERTGSDNNHQLIFTTLLADLDLVFGLIDSPVKKVRSHASRLINGIAIQIEVRLELHNSAIINLIIRKFSRIPERNIEIVQSDGIIRIDLIKGTSSLEEYPEADMGLPIAEKVIWPQVKNAPIGIVDELDRESELARQCLSFIYSLENGRHSLSNLEEGYKALEITRLIETSLAGF